MFFQNAGALGASGSMAPTPTMAIARSAESIIAFLFGRMATDFTDLRMKICDLNPS
jgi:hypothetical protein